MQIISEYGFSPRCQSQLTVNPRSMIPNPGTYFNCLPCSNPQYNGQCFCNCFQCNWPGMTNAGVGGADMGHNGWLISPNPVTFNLGHATLFQNACAQYSDLGGVGACNWGEYQTFLITYGDSSIPSGYVNGYNTNMQLYYMYLGTLTYLGASDPVTLVSLSHPGTFTTYIPSMFTAFITVTFCTGSGAAGLFAKYYCNTFGATGGTFLFDSVTRVNSYYNGWTLPSSLTVSPRFCTNPAAAPSLWTSFSRTGGYSWGTWNTSPCVYPGPASAPTAAGQTSAC